MSDADAARREAAANRKGPIAWMARHSIAVNLLMFTLLGGGIWTAFNIQKEVYPEFELDVVDVSVAYPGASPAEVEQGILLPVEETVKGVQGIKEMSSTAREGSGRVELELVSGTDRMKAFQDIDQAVNRIRTFPDDIELPRVTLRSRQRNVIQVALYGQVDVWTLRRLAERLRDHLLNHPDITQVEVRRAPDYVTHVEIPRDRLREYGLTLSDVARILGHSSRDIPAGAVEAYEGEILLRMQERKLWSEEFAAIPVIPSDTGAPIALGDLAQITDGFEESGFHSRFNQQYSVELGIDRVGQQSPLEISKAVHSVLTAFEPSLPDGVHWRIDSNEAEDFRDRLSLLIVNGAQAVVIVLLILAIFLEFRLAFWVMMGMVVSFVGGLLILPAVGVSINMVSMFAFLLVLGIVVDDAIVVGENVYEYRQRGMGILPAAIAGARDMTGPVTFSILTTIVAFIPLMALPGATGKFWKPLPVVVVIILAISLLEALFILPAHLGHTAARSRRRLATGLHRSQQTIARGLTRFVDRYYRAFLRYCIRYRYITLAACCGILAVAVCVASSDHMGMIMMPEVAADEIEAGIRLPVGVTPKQAARVALDVTVATRRMFDKHNLDRVAEGIKTNVRRGSFVDVEIVMRPPDEHDTTAAEIIALWREEIGDIPGVSQITFQAERGPGGWRDDISVDLSHADIDVLEKAYKVFSERMEQYKITRDVNDNYNRGKTQFSLRLRPEARNLGLTPEDVGRQVRDAFYGALAMRQLRGINEVEIRVKLPQNEREDIHHLEDLVIRTPNGTEVPLLDIVEITPGEAFTTINRRAGRRVVTVGMNVEPERAMNRVLEAIKRDELPRLRDEFPGITWSFEGKQAEMRESTRVLWGGFAIALLGMYALLAVAFGNYLQPLIVMIAIPFGVIGAVIGHILLGFDLSLISLMGVVALSGVVVNDALIMIDYVNKHRSDGPAFDAILQAGVRRFRPILLTTLTTFGGLTPIILERSQQAAYLVPMAISLGFGIIFATAIILVIIPCLYMILEDLLPRRS